MTEAIHSEPFPTTTKAVAGLLGTSEGKIRALKPKLSEVEHYVLHGQPRRLMWSREGAIALARMIKTPEAEKFIKASQPAPIVKTQPAQPVVTVAPPAPIVRVDPNESAKLALIHQFLQLEAQKLEVQRLQLEQAATQKSPAAEMSATPPAPDPTIHEHEHIHWNFGSGGALEVLGFTACTVGLVMLLFFGWVGMVSNRGYLPTQQWGTYR